MNVRSSVPLRTQATVLRYKIVIAGIPPVRELDVIGPLEVFNTVNKALENSGSGYDLELLTTHDTRTLPGMTGISISAHRHYRDFAGPLDTLLVAGGTGAETTKNPEFSEWLRQITVSARRIASICSGAFLLAEAGLLDGKRATTHWKLASELATHYPRVQVDPNPIWIQQGNVYTSAGITAGMDLALTLVEEDFGSQIALEVARHLVIFLRRPV